MFTANKIKQTSRYNRVKTASNLIQLVCIFLILGVVYIFAVSSVEYLIKATDTSDFKQKDVSRYFDKKTISTLRMIEQKKDNTSLPSGRTNPFN